MKIEILKILSRFIIGANQLSERNRGYEITKNVLATFSPRLISFGVIFNADGAIDMVDISIMFYYWTDK